MIFHIGAVAVVVSVLLGSSAEAQVPSQVLSTAKLPDPRGEFVRLCAPQMIGRWAHPESVCNCLHDYAAATVEDSDLREALLRGISETGVPTIETDWVPPSKQSKIGATFTKIAKPALQLHVRAVGLTKLARASPEPPRAPAQADPAPSPTTASRSIFASAPDAECMFASAEYRKASSWLPKLP